MTRRTLVAVAVLFAAQATSAAPPDAGRLAGTWLFDAAAMGRGEVLSRVWTSKLTVTGDAFALTKFMDEPKDLTGKFALDPADATAIDLTLDEFALAGSGTPLAIPAGKRPGRYRLDGDRLTLCLPGGSGGARPPALDAAGDDIIRVALVRAAADFKALPAEVAVRVTGPGGTPAANVALTGFMTRMPDPKGEKAATWTYANPVHTAPDGTAKVGYESLRFQPLVARDGEAKRMGVVAVTPAALAGGTLAVALEPECRVGASVTCDELTKAGTPLGWTNAYLMKDGRRLAFDSTHDGRFEFAAPPGKYTLNVYGGEFKGKFVTVEVPADRSEFTAEPIALTPSKFLTLVGKPAPELEGIVGWKGTPVKFADLKGKYVLLDFWGYWCGPCVAAMPVLTELHEAYAERGLTVVGVHVDHEGDVDTADKLDTMIANFRKTVWKGKDLPFPSALAAGHKVGEGEAAARSMAAWQYGVFSYPTTVLIDREGKVVGRFAARDIKSAREQVEKLLAGAK